MSGDNCGFLDDVFDDDLLGDEDDTFEDSEIGCHGELGVDYAVSDTNIAQHLQRPRQFRINPSSGSNDGYRAKLIKGTIERTQVTPTGLIIWFSDKRKLIINR